jgi:hypothetical protein
VVKWLIEFFDKLPIIIVRGCIMISPEILKPFVDYLNFDQPDADKKSLKNLGLVPNAPKEAIEAYEIYKIIKKEAEEEGWE